MVRSGSVSLPFSALVLSLLAELGLEDALRGFGVVGFRGFGLLGGSCLGFLDGVFSLDWEKSFHLRQPSKSMRACMQPHSMTLRSSQTKLTGCWGPRD